MHTIRLLLVAISMSACLACCAPKYGQALHSASFVGAPLQLSPTGKQIVPASSARGVMMWDNVHNNFAFNDTLVLYPDPADQGVLSQASAYVIALFSSGDFAIILNDSTCYRTKLNTSALPVLPNCFTSFQEQITVGSEQLGVAYQTVSDPGHITLQRATAVSVASCLVVNSRLTVLNGNLAPVGVLSTDYGNVTVLPALPPSALAIPSTCHAAQASHAAFRTHWLTQMLSLFA